MDLDADLPGEEVVHQALLDLAELVELGPLGPDPGVVGVEDGGDAALFGEGGEGKVQAADSGEIESRLCTNVVPFTKELLSRRAS